MSSFSFPHPATGVKAIQTTLLFLPAARWGKERVGDKEADDISD